MWKQQRDKKYRFFEQYKDPLTNKQKTVSVTMNDDKKKTAKQAQIILNNKINKIISRVKRTTLIHNVTFESLPTEYLDDEKKRVRRSTYYNHMTMKRTLLSILCILQVKSAEKCNDFLHSLAAHFLFYLVI